jgi:hypothetical protein
MPTEEVKFTAILGDLQHKTDLYVEFKTYGPVVEKYFLNSSQADYLRNQRPDLVPPNDPSGHPPSVHQLGTVFEFNYYTSLPFRFSYLCWVREQEPDHFGLGFMLHTIGTSILSDTL